MGVTRSHSFGERVDEARSSISNQAVWAGGIVGALVNLNALFIPPFKVIGGGLVAGFIGGYIVGGLGRGTVHGTLAGTVVGVASGALVAFLGLILGLYPQPPSLLGDHGGILLPPLFDGLWLAEPILVLVGITLLIAFDGLVGGIVGGLLRSAVDAIAGRD